MTTDPKLKEIAEKLLYNLYECEDGKELDVAMLSLTEYSAEIEKKVEEQRLQDMKRGAEKAAEICEHNYISPGSVIRGTDFEFVRKQILTASSKWTMEDLK